MRNAQDELQNAVGSVWQCLSWLPSQALPSLSPLYLPSRLPGILQSTAFIL